METGVAPACLEDHLGYWLRRVSNHVSGEFERALRSMQVSVAEWVMLRTLFDVPETTPAEIALSLGMTRGAISKVIDKLEAKRWILNRKSRDDGRGRLISLSARGRAVVPELAAMADANEEAMFGALSPEERRSLLRLMVKVAQQHDITEVPIG